MLQKCDDIFSEARHSESAVVPRSLSSADLASGAEQGGPGPSTSAAAEAAGAGGLLAGATPLPPASQRFAASSSASPMPTVPGGGIDLEGGLRGLRDQAHPSSRLTLAGETRLGYIAGVIARAKLTNFERSVFRVTRGNMYLRHAEVTQRVRDPHTGELVHKSVFIIFFSGQRSMDKVTHICDSYGANRYHYPSQFGTRTALLNEVQTRLSDLQAVIDHASRHRADRLASLGSQLPRWRNCALKQKGVYHVLNM